MNFTKITEFNFTYAIPGGAWLKDSAGNCEWYSQTLIDMKKGRGWFSEQFRKQGQFTGCWIKV